VLAINFKSESNQNKLVFKQQGCQNFRVARQYFKFLNHAKRQKWTPWRTGLASNPCKFQNGHYKRVRHKMVLMS